VKKKKVREKGFLVARIPSKKEKVREKGFLIARIPP
jgi:ribosomal protein L34